LAPGEKKAGWIRATKNIVSRHPPISTEYNFSDLV
jgi:hypothetical protein